MKSNPSMIDNRSRRYHCLKIDCGNGGKVSLMLDPPTFYSRWKHDFVRVLRRDVIHCFSVLPESVHSLIRHTRIWVNESYVYGLRTQPIYPTHSTAHHHDGFLNEIWDIPGKALGIEIYNFDSYLRMRLHWNGAGLLLHEYCHLIHQRVFGLDDPLIYETFTTAKASKKYDNVPRRDWLVSRRDCYDLAYCMIDVKEFFAEMSVTFLSVNAPTHSLSPEIPFDASPPLLTHPLGQLGEDQNTNSHCNKFYPFTRCQLEHYDIDTYRDFVRFWNTISSWENADDEERSACCFFAFNKRLRQPILDVTHRT